MPIDPVQSIRVASNLAERFGALLTPGTMTASELELKIGEGQQLYPEIWRHLDDARTALAEQGRDIREFDHLRKGELAILGVTEIESVQTFDYARLRPTTIKTASFNVAGYRRALEACHALMRAMPEIDWKALAREEEREIKAAGSLHAGKWLGIVKAAAIAAAVIAVGVIVYRLATSVEEETPRSNKPVPKDLTEAERRHLADRAQAISEAYARYQSSCNSTDRFVLERLLREDGKADQADSLWKTKCEPEHPSCDASKAAIGARLAAGFHLVQDKTFAMTCQGILMNRGNGLEPGLAIVLTAKDGGGRSQILRGVAIDSRRDAVMFGMAPGTRLAGVGDLDGDGGEELVFVDTTSLTVSQIKGPGFTDIEGPTMPSGCTADANVEGDFRNGKKGETKRLVLTVPDDVKGKGCLKPGRHFYALRDGTLSETD